MDAQKFNGLTCSVASEASQAKSASNKELWERFFQHFSVLSLAGSRESTEGADLGRLGLELNFSYISSCLQNWKTLSLQWLVVSCAVFEVPNSFPAVTELL